MGGGANRPPLATTHCLFEPPATLSHNSLPLPQALNFRVGGSYVSCEVAEEAVQTPEDERPMTPAVESAPATITQTEPHPDAAPLTSCHAIPRRVSRSVIMRSNPNYEFKGTPENMPPVIREAPPQLTTGTSGSR